MLAEADEEQQRVLDHADGPLVVTGPPGSGRTQVLLERFARLVDGGADPERVALFVLSRRAARDAREQLIRRLARSLPDLPVFTAHGYAFRLLGRHSESLGYVGPPQVLSAPEQYAFVRQMLAGEERSAWPRFGELLAVRGFARQLADFVLRAQERLLDPDALAGRLKDDDPHVEAVSFYRRYLDALVAAGHTDFAGLLFQTVKVLEEEPIEDDFDHLLVDDYQDVTPAAEAIVRALAQRARSVVVTADPGGHVFSYRGGSLEPLRRVDASLGGASRVDLRRTYRLGAEASLFAPLDDPAAPELHEPPPWLSARQYTHPGEEAEAVAHELLRRRVDEDVPWERMAIVLRRYGSYLTGLRHALARHRIPYVVVAEAAEVAAEPANRPVIDLLRYVFWPERRSELVEPLLTSAIGGLDPHGLRQLRREARIRGRSMQDMVEKESLDDLPAGLVGPLRQMRSLIQELPDIGAREGPDGVFFHLWTRLAHFPALVGDERRQRDLDALAALGNVLSSFADRRTGATVEDYLETLEAAEFGPDPWIPPEERRPHAVRIISAHRAQGLEFDIVLVAGCLEGEFPALGFRSPMIDLDRVVDPATPGDRLRERLAEERALFRLAVSRARRETILFASTSTGTRQPRTPSRFAGRLGATWIRAGETAPASTSLRTMEARLRRTLADPATPSPDRLAALAALHLVGARPHTWWRHRDWTDPGIPVREGEFLTSYSRLSPLENCGLQYLYQTELGLDPDATHYMWLGSLIHDIIDRVQRGELDRDPRVVLAALDEGWDSAPFPNRAMEHRRYLDARGMLERWIDHEQANPERSEVAFSIPIGGAVLRGRIDAIFRREDGGLRILDYKTGRSPRSKKDAHEDLQLGAYFLAVKQDPELSQLGEPKHLQLAYLGAERQRTGFARVDVWPSKHEGYEEHVVATLGDLIGRVREEDFAPSPEAECRFCRFKTICPLWPEGGEPPT